MLCPTCSAPLVRAGAIRVEPPQYWMSVYRCPSAHDWRHDELYPPDPKPEQLPLPRPPELIRPSPVRGEAIAERGM